MSLGITNPPPYASSNDALRPTFAERQTDFGEIQEEGEEDNLLCLNQPSDRHIWDGARGDWFHEEEYPFDQRPQMWKLCYGQIATVTASRGNPNFIVIPEEYLEEEDRPGYDSFAVRYGSDFPTTPANAETDGSNMQATAGTMQTAQLQKSTLENRQTPGLANAIEVVQGDVRRLEAIAPMSELDLQSIYKQILRTIFQSNLAELSNDMIQATFQLTANEQNRRNLLQRWQNDWSAANNQPLDDRIIARHTHHNDLSQRDLQTFARIMHKYVTNSRGEKLQTQQLPSAEVRNRGKLRSFAQSCSATNVPWLLRDTLLIDQNALIELQAATSGMQQYNEVLKKDAKPAHNDPTRWPNDRWWDYYVELFPDPTGKGTTNSAHALTAALNDGRAFCHTMENAMVLTVNAVPTFVFDALRKKLSTTLPDALYTGRPWRTLIIFP